MATTTSWLEGRQVFELMFTLTYADSTAAVMFTLPAGARIMGIFPNVKTALSGGTTTWSMGTSSTATEIVSGMSGAATGQAALGTALASPGHETTTVTDVYAKVGGSNTAGEIDVSVLVSTEKHTRK
jgi:hypothetical protein